MSFLNKIKTLGQDRSRDPVGNAPSHEQAFDHIDIALTSEAPLQDGAPSLPLSQPEAEAEARTVQLSAPDNPSIISEEAPSELADFSETRTPDADTVAAVAGTGLPLIGLRPVPQQQRILAALVAAGLLGLIVMVSTTLIAASQGSAQVGASGQALMQSQRLAKSVSQALVGSQQAFPEVRESTEVLTRTVRGLKTGDSGLSAAPSAVQDLLAPVLPLVDRAEKNANTVIAQQKTLTQVAQALRAINRQSADLLERAETISSLKLQQEASPAELSAVGQLVMLTQRIGKSANEFQTMEGVSPEAVLLLGKDLNSFREIAQGLTDGNAELRLPATKDPQTRERLVSLLKQFEETRTQALQVAQNGTGLGAGLFELLQQRNQPLPGLRVFGGRQAQFGVAIGQALGDFAERVQVFAEQEHRFGADAFHGQGFVGALADALRQHHQLAHRRQLGRRCFLLQLER